MSQTVGTRQGDELWVRCPACGDSSHHPDKGHLAVNVRKGVFYCVRCGEAGTLTLSQLLDLHARYDIASGDILGPSVEWDAPAVLPLAGSRRKSCLRRFHADGGWDVFEMRDPRHNDVTGHYYRREDKTSLVSGEAAVDWVSPGPLVSSPDQPIRVVEGPYDVLGDNDVACFGFISIRALTYLQGHSVIICPDGDVWLPENRLLAKKIRRVIDWLIDSPDAPYFVGLEYLRDGKDPDEVPVADRAFISRDQVIRSIYERRAAQGTSRLGGASWQRKDHHRRQGLRPFRQDGP